MPAARLATPSTGAAPTEASSRPLALAIAVLLSLAGGVGAGIALTAYAARSTTVGAIKAGPWRLLADAGTVDINPYLRAHYARSGEVPLVLAQGVTALADHDSAGLALDRRCVYRMIGPMPPSLFWTVSAVDGQGQPFDSPAGRHGFGTDELVRDADGQFAIAVATVVQPGNWLPLTGSGPFTLVLRLYETRLSEPSGSGARGYPMPRIEALRCA